MAEHAAQWQYTSLVSSQPRWVGGPHLPEEWDTVRAAEQEAGSAIVVDCTHSRREPRALR